MEWEQWEGPGVRSKVVGLSVDKQSPEQDMAARSSQGGNKSVLEFKTVHPLQRYPRKDKQRCQLLGSLAPKGRHRKKRGT